MLISEQLSDKESSDSLSSSEDDEAMDEPDDDVGLILRPRFGVLQGELSFGGWALLRTEPSYRTQMDPFSPIL